MWLAAWRNSPAPHVKQSIRAVRTPTFLQAVNCEKAQARQLACQQSIKTIIGPDPVFKLRLIVLNSSLTISSELP